MKATVKNNEMKLEDFKLMNKMLGVGAFGAVQLAKNCKDNNYFALKIINLAKLRGVIEQEVVQKEVLLHSKTDHKHIIKFYASFNKNHMLYHVLEYAENGNLYHIIKNKQRLNENQIFRYFYQTLLAIKYLHENDIIHRDIKPENLLLDITNSIKLCDFGWSDSSIKESKRQFCGTYEYMAPEIVERKSHNYKVDIWSLGVLLYEMTYGFTPFRGKIEGDKREIMENIRKADFKFNENDLISEDLKHLIQSILIKDPVKRIEIKDIITHKWVQKKLYSKPIKVNECVRSCDFKVKKNVSPIKLKKMATLDLIDDKKTSTFDKKNLKEFPVSMNEIKSVLSKPPLTATKHVSFIFNTIGENRIFTEECEHSLIEKKEKAFKKTMMESLKTLDLLEKKERDDLSIINEFSTLDISDEGTPNRINLFRKNNKNDPLILKLS